jgi:CelD/BcsL family acetyltransferase involved in cellulose biosynthesis
VPISGWLSACQGVIHHPDAQWSACDLMRECGLSAWRFDNLIVDQEPFKPYHGAVDPAPVIDLSGGFADYYAKLRTRAPRLCRETDRKIRKLDREVGGVRLVCDSADREALRLLMDWKSDQYRRTNHVDRFGAPWVVDLLESLFTTRTDKLSGLLSVLYAGDQPVSAQFGLRAGGLLVGWFAGYDARFARYSPGLIQLRLMTEGLSDVGVETLHMGKGAKQYTEALKNSDIYVSAGTVTSRTPAGLAHRIQSAANARALRVVRQHPVLHRTADRLLRGSGVSGLTYGRI